MLSLRIVLIGVMVAVLQLAAPSAAGAFCGFYVAGADDALYNNATQVVMMRSGKTTVLSMQNSYKGPPTNFAMVVPVPEVLSEENVKILPADVFDRVDRLAAPRLVEYWEQDPCNMNRGYGSGDKMESGRKMARSSGVGASPAKELGVTVEAQFAVGEYEVVILSAKFSTGLEEWLHQENYKIPVGAEKYLRPYVESGSKFFVAKVNVEKVKFAHGVAQLSPLRFHYQSDDFSLPVRLGLMNSEGKQDLIVHVLAQGQRYEVANYPNVTIPTNLNVSEKVGESFGEFYAALFDRTLEKNPRAVVTEYSWSAASCDPCPTPALNWNELATLGYDVIGGLASSASSASSGPPSRPGISSRRRPGPRVMGRPTAFVLTRLHARYSKDDLGEDLVFKEADPIAGGREHLVSEGKLEEGATESYANNFQSRYAMRHEWKGPIECESPRRGIWGGPPGGGGKAPPKPALNLAFAARGSLSLTQMVPDGILELGLAGSGNYADKTGSVVDTGPKVPTLRPKTVLPEGVSSGPSNKDSKPDEGCSVGGSEAGTLWMSLLLVAMFVRRRRWVLRA